MKWPYIITATIIDKWSLVARAESHACAVMMVELIKANEKVTRLQIHHETEGGLKLILDRVL